MAAPDLLTVAEVAAHYGVADRTVRRRIAGGQLASVRTPGGGLRIPATELEEQQS